MSYPGEHDARMPQDWQRQRSGYRYSSVSRRDPVRGFPPAPGASDPEYPPSRFSGWNGTGGSDHVGHAQPPDGRPGGSTDVLTIGQPGPGTAAPDGRGPVDGAWNADWGGGPWGTDWGAGPWPAEMAEGDGRYRFALGSHRSRTWSYGEDDPTEIWTLGGPADPEPEPYGDTSGQTVAWPEHYAGPAAQTVAQPEAYRHDQGHATVQPEHYAGQAAQTVAQPEAYRHDPAHAATRQHSYLDGLGQADAERADAERRARARPARTATARQRKTGRRGRPRRRRRLRTAIVAAVAALAAVALAATAVNALTKHPKPAAQKKTAQASPSPPPSTPPAPQLGKWQYIDARADDPIPLTLAELYPTQVSAGLATYVRTAERANASCRNAVFGSRLAAAVRTGCSQALRASYLSADGKLMGTIGVLNLTTSSDAAKVGKVVAAAGQFIEPLPAFHGVTRNLGKGTGVVWAVAKGHYLILMWAQYANLHSPTTSHDRKVLMQVVNDLYRTTANQSLTRRMVTGKPLTP